MRFAQIRRLPLAAALAITLATALVSPLAGCHKEKPAPPIDGLTDALNRAADKALAAPPLANEQIVLPARPGQLDAQASEIIAAASAAGGVAIRSINPQGQTSILATIPVNNADSFKAALRHETAPMNPPSSSTTLIEVLIENAAASPSP
jgi:hypothetical protein